MSLSELNDHMSKFKEDVLKRLQNEYNSKIDQFYSNEVEQIRYQVRLDEQQRFNTLQVKLQHTFDEKYAILKTKEQNLTMEQLEFSNYVDSERKNLELTKQLLMQSNASTLALIEEKRASLGEKDQRLSERERELNQKGYDLDKGKDDKQSMITVEIEKYKNTKLRSVIEKEEALEGKLKVLEANHINLTNLRSEVERLYADKQSTSVNLKELNDENIRLVSENKRLNKMYQELKTDAEDLAKYLDKNRNTSDQLQNKIIALENENFTLTRTIRELNTIMAERTRLYNAERDLWDQRIRNYQGNPALVMQTPMIERAVMDLPNRDLDKPLVPKEIPYKLNSPKKSAQFINIRDDKETSIHNHNYEDTIPIQEEEPSNGSTNELRERFLRELDEDVNHNQLKSNMQREIEEETYKKEVTDKDQKSKRFFLDNLHNVIKSESILVDTVSRQNTLRDLKDDKMKFLEKIDASGCTEDILDEF